MKIFFSYLILFFLLCFYFLCFVVFFDTINSSISQMSYFISRHSFHFFGDVFLFSSFIAPSIISLFFLRRIYLNRIVSLAKFFVMCFFISVASVFCVIKSMTISLKLSQWYLALFYDGRKLTGEEGGVQTFSYIIFSFLIASLIVHVVSLILYMIFRKNHPLFRKK